VPRLLFFSLEVAKDSKEHEGVSLCETLCASWLGAKTLPFFFRSKSLRARRCTKLGVLFVNICALGGLVREALFFSFTRRGFSL
jgi:hypothetical protein